MDLYRILAVIVGLINLLLLKQPVLLKKPEPQQKQAPGNKEKKQGRIPTLFGVKQPNLRPHQTAFKEERAIKNIEQGIEELAEIAINKEKEESIEKIKKGIFRSL